MGKPKAKPEPEAESPDVLSSTAAGRLRSIIERVERLEEDKAAVASDIKEVFAEAKGEGFCTKTLRKVVRYRAQDRAKRQEEEALLDLYLTALDETPIERACRGESLASAMVAATPEGGSVTIISGGKGVKLSRSKDGGEVRVEEVNGRLGG